MDAHSPTAQSSTPQRAAFPGPGAFAARDEEDVAIGCECANPELQIDAWRVEVAAQPLRPLY